MPQTPQIILDVTGFGPIDPRNEGKRVSLPRKASQLGAPQQSLLRSAVTGVAGNLIPGADVIRKALAFSDAKTADVTVRADAGFPSAIYAHDVTVGLGVDAQLASIVTFGAGGGLYFSTLPELGVYTSVVGAGLTSNYSAFVGLAVTVVFGPPSTFSGDAIAVGVDISLPGPEMAGIGGALLFSASLPIQCIGFQIQGGFSPSVWPVDVTVQISRTTTWAVAR
jgi:hypothetical protein